MLYEEAISIVGSDLGIADKMPGYTFGLPAKDCITGMKLHKIADTVCSKCYALRGNYTFHHVIDAQKRRLAGITNPHWVDALSTIMREPHSKRKKLKEYSKYDDLKYFRWHDSGDLQSVQHMEAIAEIARRFPEKRFWLPTREYGIVKEWIIGGGTRPTNLVIRLSAHLINGPLPLKLARELGLNVSGVHTHGSELPVDVKECKAYTRDNKCGKCRLCWKPEVMAISYPKH